MYVDYHKTNITLSDACTISVQYKNEQFFKGLQIIQKELFNRKYSRKRQHCGSFLSLELALQILQEEGFTKANNDAILISTYDNEIIYEDKHSFITFYKVLPENLSHLSEENPFEFFL